MHFSLFHGPFFTSSCPSASRVNKPLFRRTVHLITMGVEVIANSAATVAEKLAGLSVLEQPLPESPVPATQVTDASVSQPSPDATQPKIASKPNPSYPKSRISIIDRFIDEPRPLKVAVVGGGLAGILAGILLPAKVPNIQLTIYEKNADFVSFTPASIWKPQLTTSGRHLVRKCLPRCTLRHPLARIPIHL